jgi:uncharacterized damage-inducible protein DinB
MSSTSALQSLFQYKAWAVDELFGELSKVDVAAHPEQRHLAIRLMNHIYVIDRVFAAHLSGVPHAYTAPNTTDTPTLEALREACAASDKWYGDYLKTVSAQALEDRVHFTFLDGQHGCMSREEMLLHVATHGNYHRGAVGRIIAQLDIAPPPDAITVFLHRTEPERRSLA